MGSKRNLEVVTSTANLRAPISEKGDCCMPEINPDEQIVRKHYSSCRIEDVTNRYEHEYLAGIAGVEKIFIGTIKFNASSRLCFVGL